MASRRHIGCFRRWSPGLARRGELELELGQALGLLQTLDAPMIIAPRSRPGKSSRDSFLTTTVTRSPTGKPADG